MSRFFSRWSQSWSSLAKGGLLPEIQTRSFPGNTRFWDHKMEGSTTLHALYAHLERSIDFVSITNRFFIKFYINIMRKKSQLENFHFFSRSKKKSKIFFHQKKWNFWKLKIWSKFSNFWSEIWSTFSNFWSKFLRFRKKSKISNFQVELLVP